MRSCYHNFGVLNSSPGILIILMVSYLYRRKKNCLSLEVLPLQWPGQPDSTVAETITVRLDFHPGSYKGAY